MNRLPTFFISHGGGPWPWMSEYGDAYKQLAESLAAIPSQLPEKPRAILLITAHWEASQFQVSTAAAPGMLYDYYGFPEYTYRIQYPASGSPELAAQIIRELQQAGLAAQGDDQRGFDHGTFTPLGVIYPQADIPVIQMSLRADFDLNAHRQAGEALSNLRSQGVLIIGSGLSYHNLRRFDRSALQPSREFDDWLAQTLAKPAEQRWQALANWEQAPSARVAHPREEHLLPLWVALGAASDGQAHCIYRQHDLFGAISNASYRFE